MAYPRGRQAPLAFVEPPPAVPLRLADELTRFAAGLQRWLAGSLAGAYAGGSIALGDFIPGASDADVFAVIDRGLTTEERTALAEWVIARSTGISARGIEFVLYSRRDLELMSAQTLFQLNVNAGIRMHTHITTDPSHEPYFWFPLDIAIVREHGVTLAGPDPRELFPELPRARLLAALADATDWYLTNGNGPSAVLAACRALRYSRSHAWVSKSSAAGWARGEVPGHRSIIDMALAARRSSDTDLLAEREVDAFLQAVREELVSTLEGERATPRGSG